MRELQILQEITVAPLEVEVKEHNNSPKIEKFRAKGHVC